MGEPERDIPSTSSNHVIPGFKVVRLDDDRLQAIALYEITEDMAAYGCHSVLTAPSLGELELLACAERIKSGLIRAAVRLARDTAPWRED